MAAKENAEAIFKCSEKRFSNVSSMQNKYENE